MQCLKTKHHFVSNVHKIIDALNLSMKRKIKRRKINFLHEKFKWIFDALKTPTNTSTIKIYPTNQIRNEAHG